MIFLSNFKQKGTEMFDNISQILTRATLFIIFLDLFLYIKLKESTDQKMNFDELFNTSLNLFIVKKKVEV